MRILRQVLGFPFREWAKLVALCFSPWSVFTFNLDPRVLLRVTEVSERGTRMCFLCLWRVFAPPSILIIMSMEKFSSSNSSLFHCVQVPNERCDCGAVAMTTSFGCVYVHFRTLPPPHIAIHDHVVLCAFQAYRQAVRRKVNSNSFVYLPGSPIEGHPRSLEEGSRKETLGSDFRRSLWNSQS